MHDAKRGTSLMIEPQQDASAAFVHRSAVVEDGASVGNFTKVWYFAHVAPGAVIGENCSLGQNTYVERNAIVGNACPGSERHPQIRSRRTPPPLLMSSESLEQYQTLL